MAGFGVDAAANTIMASDNVDFTGNVIRNRQITTDGQILIGSTASPNIRTGLLGSSDGSITWTVGAGTITGQVTGGSSVGKRITGDTGGALSPTAGNWNILGQTAGSTTVLDTIGLVSTLSIENRSWLSRYVVDTSTTVGLRGTYSTLQAAITQAIADGATGNAGLTIYIRNSTIAETITVSTASVNLTIIGTGGFSIAGTDKGTVQYTGSFTNSGSGIITFSNVVFTAAATLTNSSTGLLILNNCICAAAIVQSNAAGGFYSNNGFVTSATTLSGGTFNVDNCQVSGGTFTFSNASTLALYNSTISSTLAGITSGSVALRNTFAPIASNTMTGGTFLLSNTGFGTFDFYANTSITPKLEGESAGNIYQAIRTAVSYVVVVAQDHYIGVTSTAAARTITLPSTVVVKNQSFIIKDESGGAGTNNISVVVNGGAKTIDGLTTYLIANNYGSIQVIYDGTNYFVI